MHPHGINLGAVHSLLAGRQQHIVAANVNMEASTSLNLFDAGSKYYLTDNRNVIVRTTMEHATQTTRESHHTTTTLELTDEYGKVLVAVRL
jgi:hypothetical protein